MAAMLAVVTGFVAAGGAADVATAGAASATTTTHHHLGALPPTQVITAVKRTTFKMSATAQSVPVSADLSADAPTPGNQGNLGSCVTWAIDYGMLGWYANHDGHAGAPFAPMYTYAQVRLAGGGSYASSVLGVATNQGDDTAADYQANGSDPWGNTVADESVPLPLPTSAEQANAKNHEIGSWHALFSGSGTADVDSLKYELGVTGRPVAIGASVYSSLDTLNAAYPYYDGAGSYLGGHEMMALGYDSYGLFVQNSWGTDWGLNGRFWMSWAAVQRDVDEAYVIDSAFTSNNNTETTGPAVTTVNHYITGNSKVGSSVSMTIKWAADTTNGISGYSVWSQANGGTWVDNSASLASTTSNSLTYTLNPGNTYKFAVAAEDGAGNWGDFTYTDAITPKVFDDTSVSYSTSTGWARKAWSSAYGGYEVTTATAGAVAKFKFNGSAVAWVAPKAYNRGRAYVYVDGVYVKTVDLYAASTSARLAVYSRYNMDPSVTHTITIKVIATSGRPYVDVDAFVVS
ncbi:MAG TPA: fibronectin type III domain-containing protein, partial [Acidimicrobiia bacterium]|nr:fibronectin type III domain-containing protein [Acidimicrobiia bacterium]